MWLTHCTNVCFNHWSYSWMICVILNPENCQLPIAKHYHCSLFILDSLACKWDLNHSTRIRKALNFQPCLKKWADKSNFSPFVLYQDRSWRERGADTNRSLSSSILTPVKSLSHQVNQIVFHRLTLSANGLRRQLGGAELEEQVQNSCGGLQWSKSPIQTWEN